MATKNRQGAKIIVLLERAIVAMLRIVCSRMDLYSREIHLASTGGGSRWILQVGRPKIQPLCKQRQVSDHLIIAKKC